VREGRERWAGGIVWAGRDCLGRKRWMGRRELKKKEKEWREEREVGCGIRLGRAGDRPCVGLKEGKGVWFFLIFFKQLLKPLFKSNLLHLFHKLF
jgi:hypothetical protein